MTLLDDISSAIADIDAETDPGTLEKLAGDLMRLRNEPSMTSEALEIADVAIDAALRLSGGEKPEAAYTELCEAIEALQDLRNALPTGEKNERPAPAPPAAAPSSGGDFTVDEYEMLELEMQIEILSEFIDELDGDNHPLFEHIAASFDKIGSIPSVPPHLKEETSRAVATVEDIENDRIGFDDGVDALKKSLARFTDYYSEFISFDDHIDPSGPPTPSAGAATGGGGPKNEINPFELIIEQTRRVEDLSLAIEGFQIGGAIYFDEMTQRLFEFRNTAEALNISDLQKFLAEIVEVLVSGKPGPEKKLVDILFAIRDLLQEIFSGLVEGRDVADCDARMARLSEDLKQSMTRKAKAATSRGKPVSAVAPEAKRKNIEIPKVVVNPQNPNLTDYIVEMDEYLASIETALMSLEKEPDNAHHLNEAFRFFHNAKGIAGFLNIHDAKELSHSVESLLDMVRNGKIPFNIMCASAIFEALDLLKEMLSRVKFAAGGAAYETPDNYPGVIEILHYICEGRPDLIEGAADQPDSEPGKAEIAPEIPSPPTPGPAPAAEANGETEIEIEMNGNGKETPAEAKMFAPAAAGKFVHETMVKVSTNRLDNLINAVGELVIINSMFARLYAERAESAFWMEQSVSQLDNITRELQELATIMRMVSLKNTFQKLSRMARDMSLKSGSQIEFSFSGEETELDRNVVEELSSPLVHIIRNSMDHGIEPVDERLRKGKPEKGVVRVTACHEGGNVIIRIEDDGRGLDRDRILAKAHAMGIVPINETLEDKDIYNLIFRPGFSTASKVTEISGRGVGMDVVRKNIENIRGRVDIDTRPGRGTTFTIRLPLTLAIIDGMLVRVADERYMLPTVSIQETIRPTADSLTKVAGKGEMLTLREKQLPLFRLYKYFDIENAIEDPCEAQVLIVFGDNGDRYALMVDDIVGQQQLVIKSLGRMFRKRMGVAGGTIMGDGQVALIIDPSGLFQLTRKNINGAKHSE